MNANGDSSEPTPTQDSGEIKYGPQDKERLMSMGELLTNVSSLTELIHTHQQADQIDYMLELPNITLESPAVLPDNSSLSPQGEIKITAGRIKVQPDPSSRDTQNEPSFISDLSIEISDPDITLSVMKSGDDKGEFTSTFSKVSEKTSRTLSEEELNVLLMSIALPGFTEYDQFKKAELLGDKTFGYLIETIRERSTTVTTTGTYEFQSSDAVLEFEKANNDISFRATYKDHLNGDVITALSDANKGIVLAFSLFKHGVSVGFPADGEQSEALNYYIQREIDYISQKYEPVTRDSFIVTSNEPLEMPATDAIDDDIDMAGRLDSILLNLDFKDLDQDGFNSSNSGAA